MKQIFTSLLLTVIAPLAMAQFTLVKDFNGTSDGSMGGDDDGFLETLNSKVILRYDSTDSDPIYPYRTILSALNSVGEREILVEVPNRDDDYGPTFFDFRKLADGKLAFVANIDDSDWKVFLTDGTKAGTQELYASTVTIIGMEVLSNDLYITHKKDAGSNYDLVKINTGGSSVVKELGDAYVISDISKVNETTLIFYASDPDDSGLLKLFKSDGTNAGTTALKQLASGSLVSQQTVMTKVGSKVFFFLKQPGTDCCNYLWVTDGTSAGTVQLKEFNTVFFIDYERKPKAIDWNGKFYFLGVDNGADTNNDRVLWVSDGTAAGTTALHTSSSFRRPYNLTIFNNKLYFVAYDQDSYNYRLYSTDGTSSGTEAVLVKHNSLTIYADEIATDGTYLYMAGYNSSYGEELFRYNGTNLECAMVEGIAGSDDYEVSDLQINGSDLYFTADVPATGREVYTAEFTDSPTPVLKASEQLVYVFPNPTKSLVQVKTEQPVGQLILINSQGKELLNSATSFLNLENCPAGIYCLKVIFKDQTIAFEKVIVSE